MVGEWCPPRPALAGGGLGHHALPTPRQLLAVQALSKVVTPTALTRHVIVNCSDIAYPSFFLPILSVTDEHVMRREEKTKKKKLRFFCFSFQLLLALVVV